MKNNHDAAASDNHYQAKRNFEPVQDTAPETEQPRALTSEEFTGLEVKPPKTYAGGIPAVASATQYVLREMNPIRGTKLMLQINQKDGFDCPGCAWPDPDGHRSHFEFCENGAKAFAEEATEKRADAEFFAKHSVAELASWSDFQIGKAGRLAQPMILRPASTHYEPVSWDEAFAIIATELNQLSSPDEAVFYTSGRTSNEAAFLYQLFVREFGTNNLPDCSNMCHESSGVGLAETIGVGKGTVTLDDFDKAEAILIIGQNPGTNHPRMLAALQRAASRGAKIISVNPLPEAGLMGFVHPQEPMGVLSSALGKTTPLACLHLPVKINGDVALLTGICKLMLQAEESRGNVFDWNFINDHTHGIEEFLQSLRDADMRVLETSSGISRDEMQAAADILMNSKATIACWAMGLTQHKNAVSNIQMIVNLLLLRGDIGRPGAGACPVRGHSNVQGDRTMGIWERPKREFLDALEREFGFAPPREHGLDVVEAIKAMHEGKAKVFFAMGGNFLSATPDTNYTAEALRKCRLTVHVSTKPNRAHLVTGKTAMILPCLGRTERDVQNGTEQFVTVENSMGVVHQSRGKLEPASEYLQSEPVIVARLAHATLGDKSKIPWLDLAQDYSRIRERIEKVISGFENFNQRVQAPGGFYLPNTARDRIWKTKTGKANFTVHAVPQHKLQGGELLMMTIRSHDQYNTTIYGLDDRYRGLYHERRVVLMHADDMKARDLKSGDVVNLTSHFEGEERVAPHFITVEYSVPRGCCATYFPEANVLVPIRSVAEKSNTPASKSVVVTVEKHK
jgi:molybdopterin-dependent oxidoreductase alpha subunit